MRPPQVHPGALSSAPAPAPLLVARDLCKSYGAPVLDRFSFDLAPGEVHALIGSNGAGKSTFARILCGLTEADGGQLLLDGAHYAPRSRSDAERAGVVMVPQELNVIPNLSVAENLFLNRLPRRAGMVRFGELHERARRALARVGLAGLDPAGAAGELGVGRQQLVEIAGALARDCRVLILDEPTAALTQPEADGLFEHIRRLQAEGVGVIYISHRMDEIRRIAGRITVLRDGRGVATHPAGGVAPAELIREMVGHDLAVQGPAAARAAGEPVLRVRRLRAGSKVREVTFELRAGEIAGLAGLIGSGRTETLRALFGADPKDSGEILLGADPRPRVIRSPMDAVRAGLGMVPEDRKQDGLLAALSVRANLTLATLRRHARHGWVDEGSERRTTGEFCRRLAVQCASVEQPVSELSGGNQQKIVIARWLAREARVYLFDEPTRGIDVAAREKVFEVLRELAAAGRAVLVVSSELPELTALCDRILVMSAGRIAAEFRRGEWTEEKLTAAAFSGYLDGAAGPN